MALLSNEQNLALDNLEAFRAQSPMGLDLTIWNDLIHQNNAEAVQGWVHPSDTPHCRHCALPFTHGGGDYCTYRCEVEDADLPSWYEHTSPGETLSYGQNIALDNLE